MGTPSAPEKPRPLEGAAAGLGAWWRGRKAPRSSAHLAFHLDSRFASGEVFTAQPLGCLFAQAFHTPGALEVMQALIVPDETDEHAKLPWQVRLRPDQVGATYGTAFEDPNASGLACCRWACCGGRTPTRGPTSGPTPAPARSCRRAISSSSWETATTGASPLRPACCPCPARAA
ncbi:unnamed protein product, partial [Prorocentrum cordatum]